MATATSAASCRSTAAANQRHDQYGSGRGLWKNAAYVGIVGVNDADWGGSEDKTAKATVQNCANRMSGDNATDSRRINLLKELSSSAGSSAGGCADYVGGIAGCNGKTVL